MASSPMVMGGYRPRTAASRLLRLRERLRAQLRAWLPVLGFAIVLFVESTSYLGADRTSAPLQRLAEAIFGYGVGLHWELIHHLIRKTGHFMGYGMFCLFCFRGFRIELQSATSGLARQLQAHGLAILTTFLVAGADEIHQSFLPNRCGQLGDVLLDTCGGVALGLALFLAMQATEGRRLGRAKARRRRPTACTEAAV